MKASRSSPTEKGAWLPAITNGPPAESRLCAHAAQSADDGSGYHGTRGQTRGPCAIRDSGACAMSEHHLPQSGRQMSHDEKHTERVVREQADVPGVMNEPDRCA